MDSSSIQLLIPLLGAVACTCCAVVIRLRDSTHPANRTAALLVGGAGWWSLCQVMWTAAPSASQAALWHGLGSLGWAFIGPLALHLVLSGVKSPPAWILRCVPFLYLVGAATAALRIATPWMHAQPVPGPYGWWFEPQPLFRLHLAFTYACVVPAIWIAWRAVHFSPSPAERAQVSVLAAGIAAPMVLASVTGALLPVLGIPTLPLGGSSFALLGIAVAWTYHRYGFSALVPGSFSREILATLAEGVGLVGLDGRILSGNGALASLLGVGSEALYGLDIRARLDATVIGTEERRALECELERADGQRVPVSTSTSVLRDRQERVVGTVLVVHDLREVVGLRQHLVTSGRLAAVGELAAGIAHEINNPTAFVRANLTQLREAWDLLDKELPRDPGSAARGVHADMLELLDDAIEGVERTTSIVRDVRSFAHGGSGEREAVDLNQLLEQVVRMATPQLRHHARLLEDYRDVPPVWATAQELKQVFLNLIVNAGQAIEGQGTVELATRPRHGLVEVQVRDDGHGIAREDQDRIFDPFFTTKPVGEGTGLGLAISYQILRAHDAEISVSSEPGRGTTFTVRIPAAAA